MAALTDEQLKLPYNELLILAKRTGAFISISSHTTRWSPDTCPCTIDQIADGVLINGVDDRGNERPIFIHNPVADVRCEVVPVRCIFHPNIIEPQAHFDAVLSENQLKNFFQKAIIEDVLNGDRVEYKWEFDADRKLLVDVTEKDPVTADAIKALATRAEFVGRVVFRG